MLLAPLATAPLVAPAAAQQAYPARAIHIVVPFPAGGPSDVLTRIIAERMSADALLSAESDSSLGSTP
jgi:tripartite-type tricarboxylate transporter receptor subunit TctC